ncbi:MAG: 5-formyltetrahydrofolate cyclo-ligase [Gammaproteobacteria bacterium]|nr:5-formyltetrahydrofolate cyclo-ligase [Gammaproteobacteria bacterium]
MKERQTLRKSMRARRRDLSPAERRAAAKGLRDRLLAFLPLRRAQRLALYLVNDGELDPAPLCAALWSLGKRVYLPVLHPFSPGRLLFMEYRPGDALVKNRYGIAEPRLRPERLCPAWALDLVLTPLVAFDAEGHRLGMGGGYYDRSFAFKQARGRSRPMLVGLAYGFQRVERLPRACWDVPLEAIATPERVYRWR